MNKLTVLLTVWVVFVGCTQYSPKPKAYPRVLYPEKEYRSIEADCPFTFEIPTYSQLVPYPGDRHPCWYNVYYTPFNATLHLSYIPFSSSSELDSLGEDAYQLAHKHIRMAEEIIEREVSDSTKGLRGMIYDLEGRTATPFNFYLTDGKQHFFRGSFYFNEKTARDSVQPIYDFLHQDMLRMITSFNFN